MEDKDSKQEGEGLGNGSKQRESEFTSPKTKEGAQSDDVDQVMRDRSDDQTADDGDAAAPTELEEAAKCNGNGIDDQTVMAVVSEPTTAEESNGSNNNNNNNNGEAKGGVTAEEPPENVHHRNQPADADADAVKFSTPKPHPNKKAGVVKNGFHDIEMAEAGEAGLAEDGTPAQQAAFTRELENFHREKALEFKPPKFYGELLNCLK